MIILKNLFSNYLTSGVAILICTLCLSGCDVFFIKRIDFERPHEVSEINIYEANKITLISIVNNFAAENDMPCRFERGVIIFCEKLPRTLVAFEDKSGLSVCLFGIGTSWEQNKFHRLAKALESSITSALPNVKLKSSSSEEMPECLLP